MQPSTTYPGGGGGTGTIELDAGTYTLPAISNKTITFKSTKGAVIDFTGSELYYNNSELVFDGITFNFNNDDYRGFRHSKKVVFKNCTLNGKQFLYAPEVEFYGCTLVNKSTYCLWTYGSNEVTFTDCTFETSGRSVYVYNEKKTEGFVNDITFKNCAFYNDGTNATDKAAVETGTNGASDNIYHITLINCTQEGFAANNSDSPLWGNKNKMPINEKLFVTIINEPEAPATVYSAPKTGDASQPMLWAMLAMLSAASMLVISRKRSAHSK